MQLDIKEKDLDLVWWVIHKWFPYETRNEDMFQAGCVGLVRATRKLGGSFRENSGYAVIAIKNEIIRELSRRQAEYEHRVNDNDNYDGDPLATIEDNGSSAYMELPEWLDEREKRLLVLRDEGYTLREIGKEFGLTGGGVSHILQGIKLKAVEHELVTRRYYNERRGNENRGKRVGA